MDQNKQFDLIRSAVYSADMRDVCAAWNVLTPISIEYIKEIAKNLHIDAVNLKGVISARAIIGISSVIGTRKSVDIRSARRMADVGFGSIKRSFIKTFDRWIDVGEYRNGSIVSLEKGRLDLYYDTFEHFGAPLKCSEVLWLNDTYNVG